MNKVIKKSLTAAFLSVFVFSLVFSSAPIIPSIPTIPLAHAQSVCTAGAIGTAITNIGNLSPSVGDTITYTLSGVISNIADPTAVTVNDVLSADLTFISSTANIGTYSSSTGVWNLGTVSSSTSMPVTLQISATVNAGTEGDVIDNEPTIDYSQSVSTSCAQSAAIDSWSMTVEGTPIPPSADLSVTKNVDVTTTTPGSTVHYTVVVKDNGPATSTGATATDVLPTGLIFQNATASVGNYATSTGIWTIGDLSPSSTATLVYAATVDPSIIATTTIVNSVSVSENASTTDLVVGNNTASVGFLVVPNATITPTSTPSADLSISKTADVTSTTEGGTVNYTIAVKDLGPATSTDVMATDTLPSTLTFVSATSSEGSYASSTGTWTIGTLSAGSTATLNIAALVNTGTASSTITNTAVASESTSTTDNDLSNNSSSVSIFVGSTSGCSTGNANASSSSSTGSSNASSSASATGCCPTTNATSSTGTDSASSSASSSSGSCSVPSADISITKTVDNANPSVGDTVNYTLTVAALGPATSTDVVASDTLPSGITFVSATSSLGSYASSTGIWTIGTVSAGSTATLKIAATVNSGTAGTTIDNTGTVSESTSTIDNNLGNNSSTIPITVQGGGGCSGSCGATDADIAISKTADVTSTLPGGTINYTITVIDNGPATSTDVVATDTLPIGLTFVSATTSGGSSVSSTGTIPSLGKATTFGVLGSTYTNTASTTINGDLGYTTGPAVPPAVSGTTYVDTGIYSQAGLDQATALGILNAEACNFSFGSATDLSLLPQPLVPGVYCITGAASIGTGGITLSGSGTYVFRVSGALTTVTGSVVSSINGASASNIFWTPTAATTLAANTTFMGTDIDASGITIGSTVHWTGQALAFGGTITTNADAITVPVSSTSSYASSTGTWTIGTLAPNATATLTIAALVNASTTGTITNTATVGESSTLTDTNLGNNSSSVSVAITSPIPSTDADLAVVKTVDNASPAAGATVNFTVIVTDNGPATSTFVDANDQLPSGLSFVSATTSQGFYNMTTGDWNIGTLGPNATATLLMAAEVDPNATGGTTLTNTATVKSTLASLVDPNPSNNSSSVTLIVPSVGCTSDCGGGGGGGGSVYADMSITKTVDNSNPATGATIHYTLTAKDTGQNATFGVVADDVLPAGLTFVSATSSLGSYVSSTGVWTIGALNAGQAVTLTITATVTAPGGTAITNTATVSETPTIIDPLASDNSSSVTINVAGGGGGGGGTTGGGGQVLGVSTSTGQVLGASCGLYLTSYIHPDRQNLNDPVQVKKLQTFLNMNLGLNLPITGYYGSETITAVNQFQVKYHTEVLLPWIPLGLPTQFTPTSYVYQTTERWINLIMCPALNLPVPQLVVDKGGE